jgi:dihydrofolate reductase
VVVMGRLTYESILDRLGHPLTGRTSVVVSRTMGDPGYPSVRVAGSVPEALALAERLAAAAGDTEFFVIGGESVYRDALPRADRVYLTRVHHEVPGDVAMPAGWLAGFELDDRADPAGEGAAAAGRQDRAGEGAAAAGRQDPAAGDPLRYTFLDYRRPAR